MLKKLTSMLLSTLLVVLLLPLSSLASTTTSQLDAIEDAHGRSGSYGNNTYGTLEELVVKEGNGTDYTRESFIKFNLEGLNADDVQQATLNLYGRCQNGSGNVYISTSSDQWSQDSVTWNTKPSVLSQLGSLTISSLDTYNFTVTDAIVEAIQQGNTQISFLLEGETNSAKYFVFDSMESNANSPTLTFTTDNTTPSYTLVFEDEFNGNSGDSMDLSKWEHRALGPRGKGINVEETVFLDGNGNLIIRTYSEDKGDGMEHYTGMIRTIEEWTHGKFEARIDFNSEYGMHSAFWLQTPTMANPLGDPGAAGVEIDVIEHKKNSNNTMLMALHWDGYSSHHKVKSSSYNGVPIGDGFHIYTFEWDEDSYKFYVDGHLAWETDYPISQTDEYIILSSCIREGWSGSMPSGGYGDFDTSTTEMIVDYIRVWQ